VDIRHRPVLASDNLNSLSKRGGGQRGGGPVGEASLCRRKCCSPRA